MTQFNLAGQSLLSPLVLGPGAQLSELSLAAPAEAGPFADAGLTAGLGDTAPAAATDVTSTAATSGGTAASTALVVGADTPAAAAAGAGSGVSAFAYRPIFGGRGGLGGGLEGGFPGAFDGGSSTTITTSVLGPCSISGAGGAGPISGSGADTISSAGIAALPYNPSLPLGVFGTSDTRTQVADTMQGPSNGIAYISGTFADGAKFSATGFYIDSTHLVTAGHVAYDLAEGGGFVTSMTVTPGKNGATAAGAAETVTQVAVDPSWYASRGNNENFDVAVLTVSSSAGYTPTTFSLSAESTATLTGQTVSTTGYPGEKGSGTLQGTYQYTASGTIDAVGTDELYSTHLPITAGDSGSPVYTTTSTGGYAALGIAAWGSTSTDGYTRLTTSDVAEIQAYVSASNAGTLSVGSSPTAVTGGMIAENVTGATSLGFSGFEFGGFGGHRGRYG